MFVYVLKLRKHITTVQELETLKCAWKKGTRKQVAKKNQGAEGQQHSCTMTGFGENKSLETKDFGLV